MPGMMLRVYILYIHLNHIGDFKVNTLIIPIFQTGGEPQKFNCELLVVSFTYVQPGSGARASGSFFLLAECRDERAAGVVQVL